jgi:hypothetical protein
VATELSSTRRYGEIYSGCGTEEATARAEGRWMRQRLAAKETAAPSDRVRTHRFSPSHLLRGVFASVERVSGPIGPNPTETQIMIRYPKDHFVTFGTADALYSFFINNIHIHIVYI